MSLHRKFLRFAAYPALLLLAAGCSGINARQSVSPATFFLPGLMQADPPARPEPATPAVPNPGPVLELAQAR